MGHEVDLVANPASTEPVKKFFGWKALQSRGSVNVLKNSLFLKNVVKEIRPDVIHSFSRLMYLYPLAATGIRIPVLQTYGRAISQKSTDLARKIYGKNLHFACCGGHMLNHIIDRGRWHVVYNFTDTDYFHPDSASSRDYLAFLGRIEDIKGTREAIEVAKKSGTPLVIAGNVQPEHQKYFDEKVAPHVDGDFIKYIGPVDDPKKQELLSGAKAFLMPIKWEEPFGIVMIEAMACGCPVIAFRRGSVPEIVKPGTGFIVDNCDEMAAAVKMTDKLDPAEICKYASENFSRDVIATRYLSIFENMVAK